MIELNLKHAMAYSNRGNLYNKKGEYAQALADLDKAIELKPDNMTAIHNRRGLLALLSVKKTRTNY